jgi:hypothetical protein
LCCSAAFWQFSCSIRCVPVGCYNNVMIIDERSPLDPDSGHQLKYHTPGVGNVRVGFVDDPEGEVLFWRRLRS